MQQGWFKAGSVAVLGTPCCLLRTVPAGMELSRRLTDAGMELSRRLRDAGMELSQRLRDAGMLSSCSVPSL